MLNSRRGLFPATIDEIEQPGDLSLNRPADGTKARKHETLHRSPIIGVSFHMSFSVQPKPVLLPIGAVSADKVL